MNTLVATSHEDNTQQPTIAIELLQAHIEALIFCATTPLKTTDIQQCLSELLDTEIELAVIELAIQNLLIKFNKDDFAFQIIQSGGGYQFLTKSIYYDTVNILLKQKSKKRLSNSALETIAIVAYQQPITKSQIEQIRGVASDYAIQKLLEKELIEFKGKADTIGKPALYGTTTKFMDYFGINSLKELPTLKDLAHETPNEIGNEN
jgi:segregation and condensation protein B